MTEEARERGRGAGGMGARAAAWLAWSVCAFSLVLTALGLVFLGLNSSHPGVPAFEFAFRATVITASCSSVGVIIASRRPGHPIGWLFGAVGFLSGVHLFSGEYAIYALAVGRGELWGGGVAAWITCWLWMPINSLLAFVALLFPDGRPPSPRWRVLGWINGVVAVAGSFAAAFLPGPSPWLPAMDNPLGVEGLRDARNLLDASLEALSYGVLAAGVVSLYFRYRRAGRVEHQQIKWLAYVGAVLLSGTILLNAGPDSLEETWIKQLGFALWVVSSILAPGPRVVFSRGGRLRGPGSRLRHSQWRAARLTVRRQPPLQASAGERGATRHTLARPQALLLHELQAVLARDRFRRYFT